MKLIIILTIVALMLLVGCSQDSAVMTDAVQDSASEVQDVVPESTVEVDTDASELNEVGQDNARKLREAMTVAERTRVFPSNKKISKGDGYQFALGFGNPLNRDQGLKTQVIFRKAMGRLSNELIVDDAEIQKWVVNDVIPDVTVEAGKISMLPLTVAVPSEDVQSGSYTFTVTSYTTESVHRDVSGWDEYGKFDFVVIVS
ncbi:hypothetical protein HN592_00615 [Candidatus Woesearchaeota archaeon]|nr:hypothetical protein [Candidatus Woesearchaeota archaeon]MBT4368806.1 hypothetical protein [Candidatus Woesearchaeota archaeon]MBT4712095.1 hypothetical protein [Candidatus Woesearchaeota archaeon]MBT6639157.1 hypothetical protein [Candidatus Woesearchaeota archaeon]MBT7134357.1 hypothetical protein [Candidatus Woesearchaeota archaeon]